MPRILCHVSHNLFFRKKAKRGKMDSFLLRPSCVNMCVFVDPLHMLRGEEEKEEEPWRNEKEEERRKGEWLILRSTPPSFSPHKKEGKIVVVSFSKDALANLLSSLFLFFFLFLFFILLPSFLSLLSFAPLFFFPWYNGGDLKARNIFE